MRYKKYRTPVDPKKEVSGADVWAYQEGKTMHIFVKVLSKKKIIDLGNGMQITTELDGQLYEFQLPIRDLIERKK